MVRPHLTSLIRWASGGPSLYIVGTALGTAFHYLYQILMGRFLSVEAFAELGALLAVFAIASLPTVGIDMAATRSSVGFSSSGTHGRRILFTNARIGIVAGLLAAGIVLASVPFANGINLFEQAGTSTLLILLFGLLFGFLMPVGHGILRGRQKFALLGGLLLLYPAVRVLLGVVLTTGDHDIDEALFATTASITFSGVIAIGAAAWALRIFRAPGSVSGDVRQPGRLTGSYLVLFVGIGLALPSTLDVLLVKSAASATDAGFYVAAAVIGKASLALGTLITLIAFPKMVARFQDGHEPGKILFTALWITVAAQVMFALFVWVISDPVLPWLFGPDFSGAVDLVNLYVIAIVPFSAVGLVTNYAVATSRGRLEIGFFVFALILILAMYFTADTPDVLIIGIGVLSLAYLAVVTPIMLKMPLGALLKRQL